MPNLRCEATSELLRMDVAILAREAITRFELNYILAEELIWHLLPAHYIMIKSDLTISLNGILDESLSYHSFRRPIHYTNRSQVLILALSLVFRSNTEMHIRS